MAANEKNLLEIVQKLIEACRDSQVGYRDAAEHTQNHDLHKFLNEQSLERALFAGELENELERRGESSPKRSGSLTGSVHRAWFDLKEKLGGGVEAVLSSVEAGEDRAQKSYVEALQENLPKDIRAIIDRQANRIRVVHDQIRALRDQQKAA